MHTKQKLKPKKEALKPLALTFFLSATPYCLQWD